MYMSAGQLVAECHGQLGVLLSRQNEMRDTHMLTVQQAIVRPTSCRELQPWRYQLKSFRFITGALSFPERNPSLKGSISPERQT